MYRMFSLRRNYGLLAFFPCLNLDLVCVGTVNVLSSIRVKQTGGLRYGRLEVCVTQFELVHFQLHQSDFYSSQSRCNHERLRCYLARFERDQLKWLFCLRIHFPNCEFVVFSIRDNGEVTHAWNRGFAFHHGATQFLNLRHVLRH